jgi:solute carrier family 10 (sodium/bile acid cotransporter), member 7
MLTKKELQQKSILCGFNTLKLLKIPTKNLTERLILPDLIKKYWFLIGLLFVFVVTVADASETVSSIGRWLKMHRGPDVVIVLIFLFSGLILDARQIRSGVMDVKGIVAALIIIFLVAPVIAALFDAFPLNTGVLIGIFLVAVMPTTLSSGVVMTGAAGGNMAQALVITMLANGLAVFTIPVALSLLLNLLGGSAVVAIDKPGIMIKIGFYVLLPLCAGLTLKFLAKSLMGRFVCRLQLLNQLLILAIVWMAMSQARDAIVGGGASVGIVILLVFSFHGILLAAAGVFTRLLKLGKGRRESVFFMGGQKTLPLSIILQVSLFPQYGLALVVCVLHHMIHLLMDGYLVGRLK